jgi:predicted nucleic acid-binding protein
MVLLDTSVWIFALRPSGSAKIQSRVRPLILNGEAALTDWIMLELMTGLRKEQRADSLLEFFSPLSRLSFHESWWAKAWKLAATLRQKGISPSAADCLIATTALEHGLVLWHCDKDFERIKRHSSLKTCSLMEYIDP